jgi:hypothetical protein
VGGWLLVGIAALITVVVLWWWRGQLDQVVEDYGPNPPVDTWIQPNAFFALAGRHGGWVDVTRLSSDYNPHAHYQVSWLPGTEELIAYRHGDGPHPASVMYTGAGYSVGSAAFPDVPGGVRILATGDLDELRQVLGDDLAERQDGWEEACRRLGTTPDHPPA